MNDAAIALLKEVRAAGYGEGVLRQAIYTKVCRFLDEMAKKDPTLCIVTGCTNTIVYKKLGMCAAHKRRLDRWGNVRADIPLAKKGTSVTKKTVPAQDRISPRQWNGHITASDRSRVSPKY